MRCVKLLSKDNFLSLAASTDDAELLVLIAERLNTGDTVIEKNPSHAVRILRKASALGSAEGQYRLGLAFLLGKNLGGGRYRSNGDLGRALDQLNLAAEQDYVLAQLKLGFVYLGPPLFNYVKALRWFNRVVQTSPSLTSARSASRGIAQIRAKVGRDQLKVLMAEASKPETPKIPRRKKPAPSGNSLA